MDFDKVISSRTSVREYSDKEISKELLIKIVKNGMKAPSAVNKRPWVFHIYNSKDYIDKIRFIMPHGKYEAKSIILALADTTKFLENNKDFFIEDMSASIENILLSATNEGIGTVWVGVYPAKERVDALKEALNIPSHLLPFGLVYLGYPKETPTPKNFDESDKIHYFE
jgi:nitroreductase